MPRVDITITGVDPKETMISVERATEGEAVADAVKLLLAAYAPEIEKIKALLNLFKLR